MQLAFKAVNGQIVFYRLNRKLVAFVKSGDEDFTPYSCDYNSRPLAPTKVGTNLPFNRLPAAVCPVSKAFVAWATKNKRMVGMDIETRLKELHKARCSRYRASQLLGVSRDALQAMIDTLKLDWPVIRGHLYLIDGIKATLVEHSARTGLSINTLRWRMGRAPSDPTRDPPDAVKAREFTELRRQGIPAWEAAGKVGHTYDSIRNAALKFCPDYKEVVKKAPRVRRCFRLVHPTETGESK